MFNRMGNKKNFSQEEGGIRIKDFAFKIKKKHHF